MSNLAEFPDQGLARQQAAEWIARCARGLSPAEQAAFDEWQRSPANARVLQRMSALWDEMDVMSALADVFPEPPAETAAPAPAMRQPARSWRPALAAGLLTIALLLTMTAILERDRWSRPPEAAVAAGHATVPYVTGVGEQREIALADGSALAINTDSLVEVVTLGEESRELRLLRGEAHFTVAHDPARPFRVSVGSRIVQAVGTAFNLRFDPDGHFAVFVTDGRVALLSGDGTSLPLARGELMDFGADGHARTARLDDGQMAARLAWRDGMLLFDGESLGEALAEFSRYTATRFVIADPALEQLRVGGYFPAGNTEVLLETLRGNLGIVARRDADGAVHLSAGRRTSTAH